MITRFNFDKCAITYYPSDGSELLRVTPMTEAMEPDAAFVGGSATPLGEAAHRAQNLASGGLSKAHFWHRRLKGVAH